MKLGCGEHPMASISWNLNWLWQSRVNLWYFFVVRNIWKDDDSNDEEEQEEESSDITDSEQEENKVRSRRLPARR